MGKLRHRNNAVLTDTRIKRAKGKVKALGEAMRLNFEEGKEKINNIIANWHFRRLTLLGKFQK